MNIRAFRETWKEIPAGIASTLTAGRSVVRLLPLFAAARPRTPLRVLCIMAFDTLHRIEHRQPLPAGRIRLLAALLDFGACANAALDNKERYRHEYRATLQLLEDAGIRSSVLEYVQKLNGLERSRPLPGGDDSQFQAVESYRKSVVRLSLGMVAATANGNPSLDEAIGQIGTDPALNLLFRIVMQCQIIDDVLDYSKDTSAGLPSFLTSSESLARAFDLTRRATSGYADDRALPQTGELIPLRLALLGVSTCAKLVIALGSWRLRAHLGRTQKSGASV